ncbi:hypothetical protein V493_00381 [Pseudogymnoascus sp. VKM F-4281 (FW-2241)]|nr:hypothetical protein V493_00381 [Pseudogymnoascus sp. VKM F-4281 (FW-2241)]
MHSELAAMFRKRERNDSGWGGYEKETDQLIATMIETVLQENTKLRGTNQKLHQDLAHTAGRVHQLSANYNQIFSDNREIDLKSRAWERQAIQLQNNDQALRAELLRCQNQQSTAMGQAPGALFNEKDGRKTSTWVAGSELLVNADRTAPARKRTRFPQA